MTISNNSSSISKAGITDSALRYVLEQSPGFFFILKGQDLVIEFANNGFLQAWNAVPGIIGLPLPEAIPGFRNPVLLEIFKEVIRSGTPQVGYEFKAVNDRDPGKEIYFNYVCQPIFEAGGVFNGILVMATDVTVQYLERQKNEETDAEALRLKQLYEAVTSNTPDLIYVFDLQYRFSYANPALLSMWGKTSQDSIGKGLRENGYEEWHAQMHEREIDQIVASRQSVRGEVSFPHATLGKRVYDYLLVPVLNQDGQVEAVAGTTRDISDIKAAEEILKGNEEQLRGLVQKRTSELVRSNEDLQQFAHVASHDLKEPLRKIKLFSSRIRENLPEGAGEKVMSYVDKIEKSSGRMQAMIDGVLNYSTINGFEIIPEPVDLNQVILLLKEDLEAVIEESGARFDYPPLPEVAGSPVLISQLFYNLFTNSLKFRRPEISPVIKVSWQDDPLNPQAFVRFFLQDNGIGFQKQDEEKIFQTFLRLNPKDHFEGTGLGLTLCKKIVERHGGTISAHATNGSGALFEFTLPTSADKP